MELRPDILFLRGQGKAAKFLGPEVLGASQAREKLTRDPPMRMSWL